MMRILHVFDHTLPLHSGYTFRSAAILREQRALGWETFHLSSPKQRNCTVDEETVDGLHFYRTPQPGFLSRVPVANLFAQMHATGKRIRDVARKIRPDIIHAHSPALNGMPAVKAGRALGIPVVYEIRAFWEDAAVDHGTTTEDSLRYKLTRAQETWVVRHADAVTTICEGLRGDLAGRGIDEAKITVIPNAVDLEKFPLGSPPDLQLKQHLGLAGSRVLGFIGSFYAYEGLDLLLDALPQILNHMPDIKVLLVGGGPQEAALKAQAQRLGVEGSVVFAGRVPHQEVNRYYDLIDVLVYARHAMRLTDLVTPLKPLEAMAQGHLFMASDVGGHKELIRHNETGLLFAAGDAGALARSVMVLLDHPQQWPRLKANGRRFVETERNWKNSVARYQQVYEYARNRGRG